MVDNDFINDDETLLNSETDQSYDNVEETQDSVNESVRYMQSEKDKALAENEKLKKQIQEIQESLASQQQQPVDNKINPDDFDSWESFTNPNSESYKYRMQETANIVKSIVNESLQGVRQEQATSQLESQLRSRGMSDEQIDGFFKFAETPVSDLGIDNVIKMYNAVNEQPTETSNLDAVRRTQKTPTSAGVLQGQQPKIKSDTDAVWDMIVGQRRGSDGL
tara:strand:+ start:3477 stop:4139 length:663 start_codon:yes stop_codon:yes gene_type:complete